MPHWKLSANLAFFGAQKNRFTQYQPGRDLEVRLDMASRIDGLDGVELKYPADFGDIALVEDLLEKYDFELSAVNVGTKDAEHFRYGALSAADDAARQKAIDRLRAGMDLAAELGAGLVTTCPLADAYDYPFQLDYTTTWERYIDTVRTVAKHRSDVRFCLEFQPHEPHAKVLLNNVGKMLHVCAEVGLPNFGANFDVGHSFAAGESPAEAAALLASRDRLFYMHSNDNTGEGGDWDMISGSVHFWHWLELLYTLERVGYDGWIGADITAKHFGPTEAFRTNTNMIRRMEGLLERIGTDRIAEMVAEEGKTPELYDYMMSFIVPDRAD